MNCYRCGPLATRGDSACPKCRTAILAYRRREATAKLSRGLCNRPGCFAPHAPNRKRCAEHIRLQAEADKRHRERKSGAVVDMLDDFDAVL